MIAAFREDPAEFQQDVTKRLGLYGIPDPETKAGILARGGNIGAKVEVLRDLPPVEQTNLALRESCLESRCDVVKARVQAVRKGMRKDLVEFLFIALGYAPQNRETKPSATAPASLPILERQAYPLAERTASRKGAGVTRRMHSIASALQSHATGSADTPADPHMQRLLFR